MAASHDGATTPPQAPEHGVAVPALAKRGVTRCGSAVCGVLGFEQHLGLWAALMGGIGWLIASDQAGYLLRRRYGGRVWAHLARWQPKGRIRGQLITTLRTLVGNPGSHGASYRAFLVINTASALVWGAAFVGAGYLLAARWHSGRTEWTSPALALAATGVVLGIALVAHQRRRITASKGIQAR